MFLDPIFDKCGEFGMNIWMYSPGVFLAENDDLPIQNGDAHQSYMLDHQMAKNDTILNNFFLNSTGWWLGHPSEKYERQLG